MRQIIYFFFEWLRCRWSLSLMLLKQSFADLLKCTARILKKPLIPGLKPRFMSCLLTVGIGPR